MFEQILSSAVMVISGGERRDRIGYWKAHTVQGWLLPIIHALPPLQAFIIQGVLIPTNLRFRPQGGFHDFMRAEMSLKLLWPI